MAFAYPHQPAWTALSPEPAPSEVRSVRAAIYVGTAVAVAVAVTVVVLAGRAVWSRLRALGGGSPEAPPLSDDKVLLRAVVASFPNFLFDSKSSGTQEGEVTCIVCLDDYKDGDRLRRLPPCEHAFHADCLDQWFKQHTTCPICRISLPAKVPSEDVVEPCGVANLSAEGGGQGAALDSRPSPEMEVALEVRNVPATVIV